ncbi:MAG TPA: aminotransferase class IV [Pseudonocardia sp.]|jgi:branched-subunit amino acid aminotransferase/4-amino-4-deoxychorismate lyase
MRGSGTATSRLWWPAEGEGGLDAREQAPGPDGALVVDSFLVEDGRVRALEAHHRRFRGSCAAFPGPRPGGPGPGPGLARSVDGFLAAAGRALPVRGRWFPRLEAHPEAFVLWLRPAPATTDRVRLWTYPEPDPRRHPAVKGPDLPLLADLRSAASERGADDAVLVAPDGAVVEAAHSALLWWRGDRLHHPDPALPALSSVTAVLVVEAARAEGHPVVAERCPPPALAGAEVWAVNALHGIRPVSGWPGPESPSDGTSGALTGVDPHRLARFRWLLDRHVAAVPAGY